MTNVCPTAAALSTGVADVLQGVGAYHGLLQAGTCASLFSEHLVSYVRTDTRLDTLWIRIFQARRIPMVYGIRSPDLTMLQKAVEVVVCCPRACRVMPTPLEIDKFGFKRSEVAHLGTGINRM